MLGLHHRGWSLSNPQQHLAHFLRDQGYRTARSGVHHICGDPRPVGYDEQLTKDGCGALLNRQAVKTFLERDHDQPFFLSVGFGETHRAGRGFAADYLTDHQARYSSPMPGLPDETRTRRDAAEFNDCVTRLDQHVSDVLDQLALNGLVENTLVICTTDHGVPFPGHKCSLTARGTGVMLILRGPGGFTGGRVNDALVSQLDLYPTICELLDADPPEWLEGHSLLPLVTGEATSIRGECFSEVTFHTAYEPKRGCRTLDWSYIRRFGQRRLPVLANTDDSLSKDVWLEHGWAEQPLPDEELYDLHLDPDERDNLAADPAFAATLDNMRGRLDRWMQQTEDPLLYDELPIPRDGILVNAPDGSAQPQRIHAASTAG